MTDTQLLVGSLSNDLFRVANLTQRGSDKAALRFLQEAKRWAEPLSQSDARPYIKNIAYYVLDKNETSIELAERYLMYGVLLQNYALKSAQSN